MTLEQYEARRGARETEADDEALARRLQRELNLEHRGGDSDDAGASLAASLFRFDAREYVGEDDDGRRGGRGGRGRGRRRAPERDSGDGRGDSVSERSSGRHG